jgi:hypothetical protein
MNRNEIYKSDFNFDAKFKALNSTKSLSSIEHEGKTLYFSYNTLIAYYGVNGWTICQNVWSNTTAKHLYKLNSNKSIRLNHAEFIKKAEQDLNLAPLSDPFKSVASISAIFSIMSNDEDIRKTNNQRLRFYETQGVTRPDDWDSLSEAEQKERLDKIDALNLIEGEDG